MTADEATAGGRTPGESSSIHGIADVIVGRDHATVVLSGEVDVAAAAPLRHRVRDLLVDGHVHLSIDLRQVTFLDSTGLGVLVGGLRQSRMFRGSFTLVEPSAPVRRVLTMTGLDRVFEVSRSQVD